MHSRLSSKGQVTIPAAVRSALGVESGDYLSHEIDGDVAVLRRLPALDVEFHRALAQTLDEWASDADETAFRDL